jgi:hypothetical protein
MSSPGESDIDDDDFYDISANFIAEAADLSHYHSLLPSFEDVLAQEESLLSSDGLDHIAFSIDNAPCHRVSTPASSLSLSLSNSSQEQLLNTWPSLHIRADTEGQGALVK